MITLPTKQEMEELEGFNESFCLTIYIPRIDPNTAENPNRIALKNLLKEGGEALATAGMDKRDIDQALKPAQELLEGHEFWPVQRESLALFIHPKLFRYYHIPTEATPEMLVVEAGFNLEPLREVIESNQEYYVLALGHKNVQLYEGDRFGLNPVELDNFPADLVEALRIDEYKESRETHSVASTSIGKGSEASHGQYNVSQTDKIMLHEFFRMIDRRLHGFLGRERKPLVLAGVEHLLPMYHKVNNYPNLLEDGIAGNQEHTPAEQLHQKAWSIVSQMNPV